MEEHFDQLIYSYIEQNKKFLRDSDLKGDLSKRKVFAYYNVNNINELRNVFGFDQQNVRGNPPFKNDGEMWIECNRCSTTYPATLDYFQKNSKNSQSGLRQTCKDCRRVDSRTSKARTDHYEPYKEYKRKQSCAQCGFNEEKAKPLYGEDWQALLEFDHDNPDDKKLEINRISKNAWKEPMRQELVDELNKGKWLCANCHRFKTYHNKDNVNGTSESIESVFRNKFPLKN